MPCLEVDVSSNTILSDVVVQPIYTHVEKEELRPMHKQSYSKRKKLQMYTCCHCIFSITEIVAAITLLCMETAAAIVVPTATNTTPLLLSAAILYAISLFLPASLGLLIARRRKHALFTALMITTCLEAIFSASAIVMQFTAFHAPVEPETKESQVLEAKFGVSMALNCLLILVTISQTVLCCREMCDRSCCPTEDDSAYTANCANTAGGMEVNVLSSRWISSNFGCPLPSMDNQYARANSVLPMYNTMQPLLNDSMAFKVNGDIYQLPTPLVSRPRRFAPLPPLPTLPYVKDDDKEHLLS